MREPAKEQPERSPVAAFEDLLVSGGDERLWRNAAGENRYYVDPLKSTGVFNRGSCTCSPLTPDGEAAARALWTRLSKSETDFEDARDDQRQRIKALYDPHCAHDMEVVFAPSGSDLCYLPLLFSSLLHPGRRIFNIVACCEELGSGSLMAHQGLYYSSQSQISATLPKGLPISPDLDICYHPLSARDQNGAILDHADEIWNLIEGHRTTSAVIANLVIGSKSGIENSLSVIEDCPFRDVIWTVDLCQMRTKPALVARLLELGCLLFITGSKFYQAPPFCGAMLVPGRWIDVLGSQRPTSPEGFARLFSRYDLPPKLQFVRSQLPSVRNFGLLLRWEAALSEMDLFDRLADERADGVIEQWNSAILERLERSARFQLLRDQQQTNKSIVSFRVRGRNGYLNHHQLARLHEHIATHAHEELDQYRKVLIGQPVSYGTGSFIRAAIGARDVRRFVESGLDLTDDMQLISLLERAAEGTPDA